MLSMIRYSNMLNYLIQFRTAYDYKYDRFSRGIKITGVNISGIQSHLPPDC